MKEASTPSEDRGRAERKIRAAPLTTIYRLRHIARTIYRSVDMSTFDEVPMSSASLFLRPRRRFRPRRRPRRSLAPPPRRVWAAAADQASRGRGRFLDLPAAWFRGARPLGVARLQAQRRRPAPAATATIGANSPSARGRIATGRAVRPATPFSTSAARDAARDPGRGRGVFRFRAPSARVRAIARRSTVSWPTAKRRRPPSATSPKRPTRFDRTPLFLPRRAAFARRGALSCRRRAEGRRFAAD